MADEGTPKWGAGHAAGMGRAGLKELAQALPAFPGQGVQPVEEPGVAGNLTPQEVRRGKGPSVAELGPPADAYARAAEQAREAEQAKGQDKGRDIDI